MLQETTPTCPPCDMMPDTNIRRPLLFGMLALAVLVGVLGVWAGGSVIGGAVVSHGQVNVAGHTKTVQSLDGGILSDILVQNGDYVREGQLLARLDPTLLRINLDIARGRLSVAVALRARLEAERIRATAVSFVYDGLPPIVTRTPLDTATEEAGQRAIFVARQEMRQGARDQLDEQLQEITNQTAGITAQIAALERQMVAVDSDLSGARSLLEQGLARKSQLNEQERMQAELQGELAAFQTRLASLESTRRKAEMDFAKQDRDFQEAVVTELRQTTAAIEELILEIVTRGAQLDRVEIKAPADGIVHEMQVTTKGGILTPGGTLLNIVPQNAGLNFEVRVEAGAIDQIHIGQPADVLLSSFDRQTTPKLAGRVLRISPESITDSRTGQSFYRVDLDVPSIEMALVADLVIMPGMPVEAYLHTGDRTVMSYLLQPLFSHMRQAMRE